MINQILEKAKPVKTGNETHCKGLTHREASVLLACEDKTILEKMYKLAEEIKLAFYGNRIVIFAPLYLSNYCVNGCVYCPYHYKNKHIPRKKLTQEEVKNEVIALQDMGHKRLAIESGEDPVNNPIDYILRLCRDRQGRQDVHADGRLRRAQLPAQRRAHRQGARKGRHRPRGRDGHEGQLLLRLLPHGGRRHADRAPGGDLEQARQGA